jgi:hypothetical protein
MIFEPEADLVKSRFRVAQHLGSND